MEYQRMSIEAILSKREEELWRLIRFKKDATPEQIEAWCRELTDISEKKRCEGCEVILTAKNTSPSEIHSL